ncbi:hypothetical protein Hpkin79_09850 [Helicobacter pylori]
MYRNTHVKISVDTKCTAITIVGEKISSSKLVIPKIITEITRETLDFREVRDEIFSLLT